MSHHQTHTNHSINWIYFHQPIVWKIFFTKLYKTDLFLLTDHVKQQTNSHTHYKWIYICMVLWMHIVCRVKDIFLTVCFERLSRNILMWFAMRYLVLALVTVNQLCFYDSKPCTTCSLTTQWSKWQFFDKMYSTKQRVNLTTQWSKSSLTQSKLWTKSTQQNSKKKQHNFTDQILSKCL